MRFPKPSHLSFLVERSLSEWSRCLSLGGICYTYFATIRSQIYKLECALPQNSTLTKGAETRPAIMRQAAPIFNRKGFEGAAMSDLMEATGLEKGGIYRH